MKTWRSLHDRYIAIEGIDGSGKSRLATTLTDRCCAAGMSAFCFRYLERGDHTLGHLLRRTFYVEPLPLRAHVLNAVPALKMMLFQANAVGNWRTSVKGIRRNQEPLFVIGDRSVVSLLVKFGDAFGGRRPREIATRLLNVLPLPTDILYLDIMPDLARSRLENRGVPQEATETAAELAQFRSTYEDVLFSRPVWFAPRVHRLDGSMPTDDLADDALKILWKCGHEGFGTCRHRHSEGRSTTATER